VDTAHLVVTDHLTRALMYVGMTRGRDANNAYVATHQATWDLHQPHPEQTMQDVLEGVLEDPGVEQSAHEVMRKELDDAARLDRLVPIHEYLCQLEARTRYRSAIAASGLDPSDQAAVQASPVYGALIAELRRAESVNLSVADLLHRAVTQADLTAARDVAAVLHSRVERLVTRAEVRTGHRPTMIAGLVIPATRASDPTLLPALRELESQITARADWLVHEADTERPRWYDALITAGPETDHIVRDIAAYRERYKIRGDRILGTAPLATEIRQCQHYARLHTQLHRSARPETQPRHPSPADASTLERHQPETNLS
jgi:hypothetical protein